MLKYLINLFRKKSVHKKEPEKTSFNELPRVPLKEELDRSVWKQMSIKKLNELFQKNYVKRISS